MKQNRWMGSALAGLTAALVVSCSSPVTSSPSGDWQSPVGRYSTAGYTLKWSDEFNTGTAPDPTKWNYDIGTGSNGWGNKELQYYTNRSTNIQVSGGALKIVSQKEAYSGSSYTSARINTKGLYSFTHGKIVASIMLSSGNRTGIWPAFWMLGANIDTVSWPACGESDIMENKGSSTVYTTLHWQNPTTLAQVNYGTTATTTINAFHDYELEWTTSTIIGRIDGVQVFSKAVDSTMTAFNNPFFILLNQAVGGSFPGSPRATTTFPSTMSVDYVRVYQ